MYVLVLSLVRDLSCVGENGALNRQAPCTFAIFRVV